MITMNLSMAMKSILKKGDCTNCPIMFPSLMVFWLQMNYDCKYNYNNL